MATVASLPGDRREGNERFLTSANELEVYSVFSNRMPLLRLLTLAATL